MSSDRSAVSSLGGEWARSSGLRRAGWLCLLALGVGFWVGDASPERGATKEGNPPGNEPLAFFPGEDLEGRPVTWPLDDTSDARWNELVYSPHDGLRSHLVVEEVVRGSGIDAAVSSEEITGLWVDALRRTGRFVVDRQAPPLEAPGAYRLQAKLTREASSSSAHGVVFGIRLVDGATDQVRLSFESRIRDEGAGSGAGEVPDEGTMAARRRLERATNKAAYGVAHWLGECPWQSVVSAVEGGVVRLAAGREHGLEVGMLLRVLAPGEVVIDPESGEAIGSITRPVGRLEVTQVEARSALAEVLSGRRILKAGYRVDREI